MALLPLKDDNPLKRIPFHFGTVTFMAVCIAAFFWQLSLGDAQGWAIYAYGAIPSVLFGIQDLAPHLAIIPAPLTLVTGTFLHGGWMHLIGNMLFLWVFGDNIEDAMGHGRFVAFYLICGILASLAHAVFNADSIVPVIGASGAVSGVLGAYLVLHPKARVLVLVGYMPVRLPAIVVLGFWIVLQFFNAAVAGDSQGGGVAWWAHIGGFAAGALLIVPMRHRNVPLFDGHGRFAISTVEAPRRRRTSVPDSDDRRS